MKIFFFFSILFSIFCANAACPKTTNEFQDQLLKFLIQLAVKETKGQISDFSAKLGKGGAVAGSTSIQAGTENWYFVRADYKTESVSGVVKCDLEKQKLVAESLGWDNGAVGSGVTSGPLE